jgi:hypothetical protein
MRVGSLLPSVPHVPRIAPQHPLQLLGREPASQQSPHVHLGSLDERLTGAPVQPGAAFLIGSGYVRLRITHDKGSAPFRRDVMPCRPMSHEGERISASRASG